MSMENQNRVMARQVAEVRELSLEELQLIAGGAQTTYGPNYCDWGPTQESVCGWGDDDPCALDWHVPD